MLASSVETKQERWPCDSVLTLSDLLEADAAAEDGDGSELARVGKWVTSFLCSPHPDLGRRGAVCPFVPRAVRRDALRFAVVRLTSSDRMRQIEEAVMHYKKVFSVLCEDLGEDRIYLSLLMIFPDVWPDETATLIDGTQKALKPHFVRQGLMLGEFHARNEAPGLHNPEFRPQQSPIPMLVIRHMVPGDIVFLNKPTDPASDRIEFLTAYLKFQTSLTPKELTYADAALQAAKDEGGR